MLERGRPAAGETVLLLQIFIRLEAQIFCSVFLGGTRASGQGLAQTACSGPFITNRQTHSGQRWAPPESLWCSAAVNQMLRGSISAVQRPSSVYQTLPELFVFRSIRHHWQHGGRNPTGGGSDWRRYQRWTRPQEGRRWLCHGNRFFFSASFNPLLITTSHICCLSVLCFITKNRTFKELITFLTQPWNIERHEFMEAAVKLNYKSMTLSLGVFCSTGLYLAQIITQTVFRSHWLQLELWVSDTDWSLKFLCSL